jgi:integrase
MLTGLENSYNVTPNLIIGGVIMRGHIQEYRQGRFRVIWYYKGERFSWTKYLDQTPLYHRRQAERVLEHINSLIDMKRFDPQAWKKDVPYIFEKAIQIWIDKSTCSLEWLDKRRTIAERFLTPFFKGEDIREIRKIHIDNFHVDLKKRGYSDKYIYNILGELKAFFYFHRESLDSIPVFPKMTYQEAPIRWIDREDQDRIFEFIPDRYKPIFTFMRFTGCRPNEAGGLQRENVYVKEKYFILSKVLGGKGQLKPNTKTKIARPLPIIPEIEDALKPREVTPFVFSKNGRPYTNRMLRFIWDSANRKAHEKYEVPIINLYNGLKHSFGCQRLNDGFTMDEIKAVMGHTTKRTTERYSRYKTDSLSRVMSGHYTNLTRFKK